MTTDTQVENDNVRPRHEIINDLVTARKEIHDLRAALAATQAAGADSVAALEAASFLIDEITELEGREGLTDHEFAEQVIALAHSKRQQIRDAIRALSPPASAETERDTATAERQHPFETVGLEQGHASPAQSGEGLSLATVPTPPASAPAGVPDTEALAKMLSHVFIGDGHDWRGYLTKAGQLRDRLLDWMRDEGHAPTGAPSEDEVMRALEDAWIRGENNSRRLARAVLALFPQSSTPRS